MLDDRLARRRLPGGTDAASSGSSPSTGRPRSSAKPMDHPGADRIDALGMAEVNPRDIAGDAIEPAGRSPSRARVKLPVKRRTVPPSTQPARNRPTRSSGSLFVDLRWIGKPKRD